MWFNFFSLSDFTMSKMDTELNILNTIIIIDS